MWARFRDDIYVPWTGTEEQLLEFDRWLNNLDPNLKFKINYSRVGLAIEYLDLIIYGPTVHDPRKLFFSCQQKKVSSGSNLFYEYCCSVTAQAAEGRRAAKRSKLRPGCGGAAPTNLGGGR